MGNIKNKRHHKNRRHIFRRRLKHTHKYGFKSRVPLKELQTNNVMVSNHRQPQAHEQRLIIQEEQSHSHETESHIHVDHITFEGSRIINIHRLQTFFIDRLTSHTVQCGGAIILKGETRDGLASVLSTCCSTCGEVIQLETSDKVQGPRGYRRWECNLAAVWGQMSTGGGHAQLQETMSVLGVPVMTKKSFIRTEKDIGEWWRMKLNEAMIEAGKEEKRLAEERGDYHNGVPAITVIVDGGWSKRSHKHTYSAKSGVGIIIGKCTSKLLYIGVRNKYCTACTQGIPKDKHDCYKNWDESSSQMETDIILEGFLAAEKTHGVRYMRFVGDGDSSVYPTLQANVPEWGRDIKKIECANHACKCYRASLEKLVANNPSYKGKGGLTVKMRKRLTSAARCAIKMRSEESDTRKAVKLLEQDLANGPLHCFGFHGKCSTDFCKVARERISIASNTCTGANGQNDGHSSCESGDEHCTSSNNPQTTENSDRTDNCSASSWDDIESRCPYIHLQRIQKNHVTFL